MKQHKYRKELQNRTINPSPDSWEKLHEKLVAHDAERKGGNWIFLKIASVILVVISVGFYFLSPKDDFSNTPVIAAPTVEKNSNTSPDVDDVNKIEVATSQKTSTNGSGPTVDASQNEANTKMVVFAEPAGQREALEVTAQKVTLIDTESEGNLNTETMNFQEQTTDDEIEQLLHTSKIKLIANGQISSQKLVNADALLNSVEDDLNKSLKQKLLEKIVTSLKKDKEVVSSKEN